MIVCTYLHSVELNYKMRESKSPEEAVYLLLGHRLYFGIVLGRIIRGKCMFVGV